MTPDVVHEFLREIGRNWSGKGVAMELGCWLGASSVPLLEGLMEAGYDKPFYAFDRWKANSGELIKAASYGVMLYQGEDIKPRYIENVKNIYKNILCTRGDIPGSLNSYNGEPIEICIFDAPKRNEVFNASVKKLMPHFIPGVTVWGLLDYYSWKKKSATDQVRFMAPVRLINQNPGYFKLMAHWPRECSCAFFKYLK